MLGSHASFHSNAPEAKTTLECKSSSVFFTVEVHAKIEKKKSKIDAEGVIHHLVTLRGRKCCQAGRPGYTM